MTEDFAKEICRLAISLRENNSWYRVNQTGLETEMLKYVIGDITVLLIMRTSNIIDQMLFKGQDWKVSVNLNGDENRTFCGFVEGDPTSDLIWLKLKLK